VPSILAALAVWPSLELGAIVGVSGDTVDALDDVVVAFFDASSCVGATCLVWRGDVLALLALLALSLSFEACEGGARGETLPT